MMHASPRVSKWRACRRAGFTLPEVLATLVLVGIVLPVAMKGISLALAAAGDARHKLVATAMAENKLAELTADALVGQAGGTSGEFEEDSAYRWESSIATRDTDLMEIQVRVLWTARGLERSIALSTMIYSGTGSSESLDAGLAGIGGMP